jgi:nucleoside diphosphate kinase
VDLTIAPYHAPQVPGELSNSSAKRLLYAVDTYFVEAWEDSLRVLGQPAAEVLSRHALALIKPDAIAARALDSAFDWLRHEGFRPVFATRVRISRLTVRAIWAYHWNSVVQPHKDVMDLLLCQADSLLVLLHDDDPNDGSASARLTKRKGPANPARRQPGQLRHALGAPTTLLNFVHTADEPADLVRELGVLFARDERDEILARARSSTTIDVAPLVRALYAEQREGSLELSDTLSLLAAAAADPGAPPAPKEVLAGALNVIGTAELDWRPLVAAARECGADLDVWDQILLGTHLTKSEIDGVQRLL